LFLRRDPAVACKPGQVSDVFLKPGKVRFRVEKLRSLLMKPMARQMISFHLFGFRNKVSLHLRTSSEQA
jgi:hypothetical protein